MEIQNLTDNQVKILGLGVGNVGTERGTTKRFCATKDSPEEVPVKTISEMEEN